MLVQVCEEIHSENQDREVNGLLEAMNYFGLSTGYIVTKSQDDYLEFDDKKVVFLPINQWMKIEF
jgi:hypothetical protein